MAWTDDFGRTAKEAVDDAAAAKPMPTEPNAASGKTSTAHGATWRGVTGRDAQPTVPPVDDVEHAISEVLRLSEIDRTKRSEYVRHVIEASIAEYAIDLARAVRTLRDSNEAEIQRRIDLALAGHAKADELMRKGFERSEELRAELKQEVRTLRAEFAAVKGERDKARHERDCAEQNAYPAENARICELEADVDRLTKERDDFRTDSNLWRTRAMSAILHVNGGDKTCREYQEAEAAWNAMESELADLKAKGNP